MGLTRLLLAWLAATGWFLLWEIGARQVGAGPDGRNRPPVWHLGGEALLFTLLAALWFASLGSGGWVLVFLLLGALSVWPPSPSARPRRRARGREVAAGLLGVLRVLAAGGLFAWILAPA